MVPLGVTRHLALLDPRQDVASNQPIAIFFRVDGFAEASAEQRALLSSSAPFAVSRVTPLKNVLARGEIEATHVDARISKTSGPWRLTVTLLDLARVQQSLREGAIDRGLYVGTVLGDKDETRPPIAIVQVLLTGD